ncbi:MAG: type 4a pilus biogenesis protein PilO [Gammaproteobacteria bacterium]|nr:type 4a pilus biogenesis protein PilO [Gammaproteobacteria bacterium]MCW8841114.1 type 4a pilus biogenesis protein PilO [Gammaproteobacteria bacterium]MCW8959346.1 type 4a pilus biogenesis protein PilO [Gammaproteobacteria bacterium]MCW8972543.1 type 4a pilus biogenesis protein PilO [Gammaproteobacteria bacterium]MCW8993155.1 type 4a pilus biogenesis protein PilO [Gammaproteobacteria bacterium]
MSIDLNNFADQFRNLDPDNIGNWPVLVRGLIVLIVAVAVLGAGYYFDTQNQLEVLARHESTENTLKKDFEKKQSKAVNLEAYQAQMVEMEESFGTMLRQLPSKTEVADLLVDITQTGLASGLEFDLFKPNNESPKEFYAELPISIEVNGGYHQLGAFVSGVAALPRIVTLHDIQIKAGKEGQLKMAATAKTYRYLDEDELAAGRASKKRRRR